jgi:class 3 adenylate cyclase
VASAQPESSDKPSRSRVRFPLWLKLGLLFGGLSAITTAAFGYVNARAAVADERAEQRTRMLRWVEVTAKAIDVDTLRTFRRAEDMDRPEYRRISNHLHAMQKAANVRWAGLYRREGDRDSFLVDMGEAGMPIGYPLFDTYPELDRAFAGEVTYLEGFEDQYGLWESALAPVRAGDGEVVAVAAMDIDANWVDELMSKRLRELLLQLAAIAAAVLIAAAIVSRLLGRHLLRLAHAAHSVARGDLAVRVAVVGHDEVGELSQSFNTMVHGLRERDVMRDAFGRYVTPEMAKRVLADPNALRPGGELRRVTLLMSDLRGFTSLSERLSAADMVALLNAYLGRMADLVAQHEGTVIEFIGDAVMALFGAPAAIPHHAHKALACAAQMQCDLERFNAEHAKSGLPPLEMGIGVHTGTVIVGNIGSERRLKYGVVGDDVNQAGRIESFTVGGEVLLSEATRAECEGLARLRGPVEVRAKGKSEPLRLYALVSVSAGDGVEVQVPHELRPEEALTPVDLPAAIEPLEGKAVAARVVEGRVVGLSPGSAELLTREALPLLSNVRLRIGQDAVAVSDLYAKVSAGNSDGDGRHRARLRFTSVPSPERLAHLIGEPAGSTP